jgi:hypothetical protein
MLAGKRSEVSVMVVPAPDKTLPIPPTLIVDIATSRVDTEGTPDVVAAPSPPTPASVVTVPVHSAFATPPAGSVPITPNRDVAAPAPVATTVPAATVSPRLGDNLITTKRKGKEWGKLFLLVPLSAIGALGWVQARKFAIERGALSPTH